MADQTGANASAMSLNRAKRFLIQYRLTFLALAVITFVISVYWQSFSRIIEMWSISDYQYGWFVYPLCLYIIIRKRELLTLIRWQPSVLGLALLVMLILLWLISIAVGVQALEFACATLLMFALYWTLAGTEAMRVLAFPLLLLLAAVPMGGFLSEPLMRLTAEIASALLALTGVPVFREGQFFELPGGNFEVAEICNGFRYLLASTQISLVFAYLTFYSNIKRLTFILAVAVGMIITNGVRAFIVMYVASATNMRVLGGYDHVIFGMILFAAVLLLMIWIGDRYADVQEPVRRSEKAGNGWPNGFAPQAVSIAALVTLMVGPPFAFAMTNRVPLTISHYPTPVFERCDSGKEWKSEDAPAFQHPDFEESVIFFCGDYELGVYVASYGLQKQGKELIAWNNKVWPYDWRRYADESLSELNYRGSTFPVRRVLVRHPEGWRLISYWYQVGPWQTSSETVAKIMEAFRAITLQQTESSIVVVSVISEDQENAELLRTTVERHASVLMSWNKRRIDSGSRQ